MIVSCIGYCPSRRLQDALQRRYHVEHPWQLSYEQYRDLYDRLTLSEGRTELDRIARALHSDQPLLATLEQYRENLPRIVRVLPHLAPGDAVTLYRSIARDDPHRCIRPGDWVALEPTYARYHGGAKARLLKKRVPVEHVAWAGTSEDEWVYAPCPVPEMSVYEYLLEYGKAGAGLGRIDFPTEEEFLAYHRTGYIEPSAYERYEEPGGLRWVGRGPTGPGISRGEDNPYERYPVLLFTRQYGPYLAEFRQTGRVLQYTKTDEEGWPVYGPDGRAIMLTPEEIRAEGLIETSPDIAVFVDGETVGLASDEWGAIGIYLEQPYQHLGIGTDLLIEYLRRHPRFRAGKGKMGQMTPAGARLAKAAYRKMRRQP